MEDVLTEIPPPSRTTLDDLNNFSTRPPRLPKPILALSDADRDRPLCPDLLVIALSEPSLRIFQSVNPKALTGGLILPEISFAGNTLSPSIGDKSCNIYALNSKDSSINLVSFQYSVNDERCNAVAKVLIGDRIIPKTVLILDSVSSRNFREKLPPDETFAFKLETTAERRELHSPIVRDVTYFPSGSVVGGLGAALLTECQLKNIRGTLLVSWPPYGSSALYFLKELLVKRTPLSFLSLSCGDAENESSRLHPWKSGSMDSDLYT